MNSPLHLVLAGGFLLVGLGLGSCAEDKASRDIAADAVELPVTADGKKPGKGLPKMVFDKSLHDFGAIKAGEKVTYSFRFVNRGDKDLLVQNASGSCGCTVPDFPREPIPPGQEGYIRVQFNSEGKTGVQEKTVTVLANTLPNTNELKIKVEIIQP